MACAHPESPLAPGRDSSPKSPDQLCLVSGLVDDPRVTLEPEHPLYLAFAWAWQMQDEWTFAEHKGFWHGHLALWPCSPGQHPNVEMLAHAVARARREGHSDQEIARRLHCELDSLRRRGVLRRAGELTGCTVSDHPLPRVHAAHEPAPDLYGYPNLDAELLCGGNARTQAIHSAFGW